MRALLRDHASVYHADHICVLYGGEAMRYDQAGAAFAGPVQGLLDHLQVNW